MDTYTISCHALELQRRVAACPTQSRHGVVEEAPAAATRLNRWVRVELQNHDSEADGEHAEDDLASPRLDGARPDVREARKSAPAILMAATPIHYTVRAASRAHRPLT